jgi:PPOX class probable F420-dependent enzyme
MALLDPDKPGHARALERLGSEIAVWLTSVSAQGQPQSTPVWFHWDGETFLFYSQPEATKLANIASNPRVSLHLVGDAEAEDVVTFEGLAALDPSAPSLDHLENYLAKYRELIDRFE